jgi:hypothetical protein
MTAYDGPLEFHLYMPDEQAKAELGMTSTAICGFVREGDQRETGANVVLTVDMIPCETCQALLPAAYAMLTPEQQQACEFLDETMRPEP